MPFPPCNSKLPMQYCGACYCKNQIHLTFPSKKKKKKYTLHEGYQPKRLTRSQPQQTEQVSIIRLIIAHHDPQTTRISEVTKVKLLLHPCLHYCYCFIFFVVAQNGLLCQWIGWNPVHRLWKTNLSSVAGRLFPFFSWLTPFCIPFTYH